MELKFGVPLFRYEDSESQNTVYLNPPQTFERFEIFESWSTSIMDMIIIIGNSPKQTAHVLIFFAALPSLLSEEGFSGTHCFKIYTYQFIFGLWNLRH